MIFTTISCNAFSQSGKEKDGTLFSKDFFYLVHTNFKSVNLILILIKTKYFVLIPLNFQQGVRARFKFYLEDEVTTKAIDNTSNPDWSFKKQFNFTPVTAAVIIPEQFFNLFFIKS